MGFLKRYSFSIVIIILFSFLSIALFYILTNIDNVQSIKEQKISVTKNELKDVVELADSIKAPTNIRYTAALLFYRYSRECKNKEITPELLYAIALTESNFNPKAKSSVGALGLMQVKYSTAKWLKETYKLDMPIVNLYDLEENIYYSVKYLDFLCSHFKEKGVDKNLLLVYVIIAYNEGQNAPILKKRISTLMKHKYLKKVYTNSMKGRN